jgi:SpoVK/Ycf46/Vps4 family AAA+-type ATPase
MKNMKIKEFKKEVSTLIQAKYSLVVIETSEEQRACNIIQEAAGVAGVQRVFSWSSTGGMKDEATGKPEGHDGTKPAYTVKDALVEIEKKDMPGQKGVFILKDIHHSLNDPQIQRKLRDLATSLKFTNKRIIFLSPTFKVPSDLATIITVLDMPLPDASELRAILCEALKALKHQEESIKEKIKSNDIPSDKGKAHLTTLSRNRVKMEAQEKEYGDRFISAGLGLTAEAFADLIAKNFVDGDLSIKMVSDEKKGLIGKANLGLEIFPTDETIASIGGYNTLKAYMVMVGKSMTAAAAKYGIKPARAMMLLGVPGSGKSLTAKAIANYLQIPLVKFDVGALFGSLVGESEGRTRQAFKTLDAFGRCVLWLDEIDKLLSSSANNGDSGTSQRVFAAILTWMEESEGTFVVATCNSQESLKPELMARFPKIFFVDVPTQKELWEIVTIHIIAVGRDPKNFDIAKIVSAASGFVGREVRNIIQDALWNAFDSGVEITTEHIVDRFQKSIPITVQKAQEMSAMRLWAKNNATNASEDDGSREAALKAATTTTGGRFDSGIGIDDIMNG